MSNEAKDRLNLSLKENGQAKYEFCLEDRQIKQSYAVIAMKGESEMMNMETKKLRKMEIKKSEVEERNMRKKEMDKGKMEKKREEIMPLDKDVDETSLKLVATDECIEEDEEEKGSLEVKNAQKGMSLVTMLEKYENYGKVGEKKKFEEKDIDAVDKTNEITEKWEDEKDEKVNRFQEKVKVTQNEEPRQDKMRDSPQMPEFEGTVEINLGDKCELVKQNEINEVVEILTTRKVDCPVRLGESSSVSKATNNETGMDEISVDCSVSFEDRPGIGKAVMYEPSKRILESVKGNCDNKTEGCEETNKLNLNNQRRRSSPVESTGEGSSVLCLSCCVFFETMSKFQMNHNAPNPTNISWINISSHTYKELPKTSGK